MKHTTIAVDLAKSVFEVAVSQKPGQVSERQRLTRTALRRFFAQRQPSTVLLEACGSAHYWARWFQQLGHSPILLPPQHVRPYVPRNKTDRADAKALLEAFRNDQIRPVPIKTLCQQTLASLHRIRSAWLPTRTSRINSLRGLLRELGILIPLGARFVVPSALSCLNDPDAQIPPALRPFLLDLCSEIRLLESKLKQIERSLQQLASQIPAVQRFLSIPGVGLITATAIVAFVGDLLRFPSGRHFASYLGLTPRESSSGCSKRLGRISKRGDVYLRMLLIHGARSVLWSAKSDPHPDRLAGWALKLERRSGHNKAAVALANKLARIVWALAKDDHEYRAVPEAA